MDRSGLNEVKETTDEFYNDLSEHLVQSNQKVKVNGI